MSEKDVSTVGSLDAIAVCRAEGLSDSDVGYDNAGYDNGLFEVRRKHEFLQVDDSSEGEADELAPDQLQGREADELAPDRLQGKVKLPSQVCVDFASDSEDTASGEDSDGMDCQDAAFKSVPWVSYEAELDCHVTGQNKGLPSRALRRGARSAAWLDKRVTQSPLPGRKGTSKTKSTRCIVLSVTQVHSIQASSLFKLNAFLVTYCNSAKPTGFDPKSVPSVCGKPKMVKLDLDSKVRYGASLCSVVQKTGLPLPPFVINALNFLFHNHIKEQGLFRRAGSAKRVVQFQAECEENPYSFSCDGLSPHDIADSVKHFFRDLPERLFNQKLTHLLTLISTHVPEELKLYAFQCALQLLPDANKEALYMMVTFLGKVAEHQTENSMSVSNLAVCWTPTLCTLEQASSGPGRTKGSIRAVKTTADAADYTFTQNALEFLIMHSEDVFYPPAAALMSEGRPRDSYVQECSYIQDLGFDSSGYPNIMHYLKASADITLKEHVSAYRGWVQFDGVADTFYKKVNDGFPLRLWRCSTDIPATAAKTVWRITRERHLWDDDLLQDRVVEVIADNVEVYQYVQRAMFGSSRRSFICLRSQHTQDGVHLIIMTSVQHVGAIRQREGVVQALDLAVRFIVEPFGSTCRLNVIVRQDLRGHAPQYYRYGYGPFGAACAHRIRDSFQNVD